MRSNIAAPSRRLFLGAIAPVLGAVALGPAVASIAVVGDSLAAGCPFRTLSCRPFEVINLAKGGARLADIAGQLERAQRNRARRFIIDGGLNDLFGAAARRRIPCRCPRSRDRPRRRPTRDGGCQALPDPAGLYFLHSFHEPLGESVGDGATRPRPPDSMRKV
ncbi:hypothetical protein [Methylocystis sp.]|uniref:hypothetical protein n=1 Tax=Methylocystis sp. TaxID=1911079 RepID=UPI0025DE82D4|nr:hypothetical protein [Methylocystis sp.]